MAAATAADHLIVANVSNWGATGLIAALSAYLNKPSIFHDGALERRCIEHCVAFGGWTACSWRPKRRWMGFPQSNGKVWSTLSATHWSGLRGV
ncbi:glutamate cyclase domain-containing protein [Gemmobacter lanyuensis]